MIASSVSRKQFVIEGCQLGGQAAMIGSVVFGLVIMAAGSVAGLILPHSGLQAGHLLVLAEVGATLIVATFLYSFWFGIAAGAVLAWTLLKRSQRPGFSERLARRDGLLIGIAVGLLMIAPVIAIDFALRGTGTLPHGAAYTLVQEQQVLLSNYLITLFYVCIATIVASILGARAGKSLYHNLPSGAC